MLNQYKVAVVQAALCDYLDDKAEGLLYADIDLGAIAIAKSFADPAGHYV